jgi:hypothetical protein
VVLVSAMIHGLKPERVELLREAVGIDRRTLERWRQWWLVRFVESSFWREARARFMPPLCPKTMPLLYRSELLCGTGHGLTRVATG